MSFLKISESSKTMNSLISLELAWESNPGRLKKIHSAILLLLLNVIKENIKPICLYDKSTMFLN